MLIRSFIRSSSILTKLSHFIVVLKRFVLPLLAIACVNNTSTDVLTIPARTGTTFNPSSFIVIWEVNWWNKLLHNVFEPSFITPSAPAPIIFQEKSLCSFTQ